MTPFSFEWEWDIGDIIFFGFLYLVLTIVGLGLSWTGIKTVLQILGLIWERDLESH